MQIKTVQWNIGGGKTRSKDADGALAESYSEDNLGYIINTLKALNPDIVTFQETHADKNSTQVEQIANALGYEYFFNDEYDDSHITKGQRLSQSVLSRFPITNHNFSFFFNPGYKGVMNGKEIKSRDKGISTCDIVLPDSTILKLQTLHLIPFVIFNVDALGLESQLVRSDVAEKIDKVHPVLLLQGDFNYDNVSLQKFLPSVMSAENTKEIIQTEATTPKNRKYDHIVYRGLLVEKSEVDADALTDHYPIVTTFSI